MTLAFMAKGAMALLVCGGLLGTLLVWIGILIMAAGYILMWRRHQAERRPLQARQADDLSTTLAHSSLEAPIAPSAQPHNPSCQSSNPSLRPESALRTSCDTPSDNARTTLRRSGGCDVPYLSLPNVNDVPWRATGPTLALASGWASSCLIEHELIGLAANN
jgi:hypothetical protein